VAVEINTAFPPQTIYVTVSWGQPPNTRLLPSRSKSRA